MNYNLKDQVNQVCNRCNIINILDRAFVEDILTAAFEAGKLQQMDNDIKAFDKFGKQLITVFKPTK